MANVSRVFVEKKPGFDVEAQQMRDDLVQNLGLKITALRMINRYDISGLSAEEFAKARDTILSEPNQDTVYDEDCPLEGWQSFAMEYLPGQYDQRADSAAQCVQLLTQGERPQVMTAKVIAVQGNLSEDDFTRMEDYLINPVESRPASMDKPESLQMRVQRPADVQRVQGFMAWDDAEMKSYYASMGFAMTMEDLYFVRDYFRDEEQRNPSVTELRVIDTYWSDHCRHTTFSTKLKKISVEESAVSDVIEQALKAYYDVRDEVYGKDTKRPVSLMDMAVIGMKVLKKRGMVPDLDQSEEINACSIEVPVTIDGKAEKWLVQFKNETHNHPTEIEPFGGAATCLGGAIRDPLSGRAYVYQAMRVTGSGDPRVPVKDTLRGKLPSRKITTGAAHGYSSYGNQIGLATGQVHEFYDAGYVAKRMEIGAVIGASPKSNVVRSEPQPGDVIVLLGGATGRDGIGGATGSSKAHTEESVEECGAEVQKGNPPTERKIQRMFRKPEVTHMIKRCNDFGAGGVSVAIGELAPGLKIDLDKVPKKYEGLDGTELSISESQERMAVVLDKKDADRFIAEAEKENLVATVVAVVTEEPRLQMFWRGDEIVNITRAFLDTNGVTQETDVEIEPVNPQKNYREQIPECLRGKPLAEAFRVNLARLEVCGQKGLAERFDSSIGASTVLMPFAGKYQLTPEEGMVAKIPADGETDDATAMAFGFMPGIFKWSPFHGAAWAVTESLSKLCAMGANPLKARLTFQEYFERMTENPKRWGKPTAALLGALSAQLGIGLPAIGGKDSMSGTFEHLDVPPTLVSFAVTMTQASRTLSGALQGFDHEIITFPVPVDEHTLLPKWDALRDYYWTIQNLIASGAVLSASVVKEGGIAAAVSKMAFGNKIGVSFDRNMEDAQTLFAPRCGALVLELATGTAFPKAAVKVGNTIPEQVFILGGQHMMLDDLIKVWSGTLEEVFPSNAKEVPVSRDIPLYSIRNEKGPIVRTAKPRVFIPVFPGTNCEYDSAKAFERAGAQTDVLVVKNLTPTAIEETIDAMAKAISQCQMIMLPGGFSGGDEPDGSGKFIATTFRSPKIAEEVARLLQQRDGLMLGICNGFQALIKLGLVPYGKITEPSEQAPTLTFNTLGRHVSRMVYTRMTSVKSPWFAAVQPGDVFAVPVSHGEGRFVASDEVMDMLIHNGQIATQYTAPSGGPSGKIVWNPNGSVCAVEGITSPDGRILGKMGHSERHGTDLYKNVPGEKDQKLFESGVKYFE
ncbi:MAG: phosphoribosylformylglycinamidine synthase [Oscillospiraceae bacterium]|jgi:phosphoribosylformylglycinamidine synthase|nr:phosphoribosylformylglycinamidine synthase [Oscillospiraceae bacterium]